MHSIVQFQIALLVHKLLQCELRLGKQVDFARGWSYHRESLCWNHQYHMEALTLRCIRPPQSQSEPNVFLKTSVCADESQHPHSVQSLPADRVYCPLALTPGVLVPRHRLWSLNKESFIIETGQAENIHMKNSGHNYICEGIWQIYSNKNINNHICYFF